MEAVTVEDWSRCFHLNVSGCVEVLHAQYSGTAFKPHWHDEFAIGLVTHGVEQFAYRGATHRAVEGELILLNAGEIHTGESADARGFAFQMLYVPDSTLREIGRHTSPLQELDFPTPVLNHPEVQQRLQAVHRSIARNASSLASESLLFQGLGALLQTASNWTVDLKLPSTPQALTRARDFLQDHLSEDVSLQSLAEVSGLSKYHLLRLFRKQFGVPPHAYQLQERVLRAKSLLQRQRPGFVAATLGFVDQSHFHRVFRALVGTTPGRYAEQFHPRRSTAIPVE